MKDRCERNVGVERFKTTELLVNHAERGKIERKKDTL